MSAPLVVSALSLCVSVLSFFFFRWYVRRKTAAARMLADYRSEVARLIAEIDAATDRDSLLVEERIKALRKLLEDTDKRISLYIREAQRSRDGEAMYASLGRGIRAALDSRQPSQDQPSLFGSESAPQQGEPPRQGPPAHQGAAPAAAQSGMGASGAAAPPQPAGRVSGAALPAEAPGEAAPPSAKPMLKAQVAEMSAAGASVQEIASRLGISIAEVDLALSLLGSPAG